ncbi:Phytanoyl-CoA dioxygenase [Penicillium samsonianum]|uniref:Phytanoyl-CoA dioxygenase n=1 Tax=Penicillium samsonianum TaxID=1882272 RepID=UPI002547C973|nr:Phytanoyl-CoA dioxygenase [Penicillium samsonianum]KAJ6138166.1 Phytanoyl-CoA dioxygenase [Penicillium samsonianum]
MSPLTPEQIASYHENGYLLLRADEHKLVDPTELKRWTQEVQAWPRVKGKWMPYDEININGERQLMRTERFIDYHPEFKSLVCGEQLAEILKAVSGDDMLLFKEKINYKQPQGNGFQAHLDAPAYDHIGRIEHVTANIAIDAATPENGCLEVVPGSHKMQVEFAEGGRIKSEWEHAHEWTSVPLEMGDMLIFGSHLAHRSAENKTDKSRSSLYATFHSRSDGEDLRGQYYKHRMEMFPPEHEREEGRDYSKGYETYGFAAPFTKAQDKAAATVDVV